MKCVVLTWEFRRVIVSQDMEEVAIERLVRVSGIIPVGGGLRLNDVNQVVILEVLKLTYALVNLMHVRIRELVALKRPLHKCFYKD